MGTLFLSLVPTRAEDALSFTTGVSASLIGVMVAVALLPPLMVFGLLLSGGHFYERVSAFLILATNIVSLQGSNLEL